MKKVHAWWLIVKQDFKNLAGSPTVKADEATLKADLEAMFPDLFSDLETVFAKILLATL